MKQFAALYETRSFIIIFVRARHWGSSWVRLIKSTPSHHFSLMYISVLSSHFAEVFQMSLPFRFSNYSVYKSTILVFCMRATSPAHVLILHFITLIIVGEEQKLYIFLTSVLKNMFNVCKSIKVINQYLYPYTIIVLYILILRFFLLIVMKVKNLALKVTRVQVWCPLWYFIIC